MSIALKILPHYTYDDWVRWDGAWELIEGHPFAMSPAPIPEHQRVAAEILTEFTLALRSSGCRNCKVYQPIDYKVSEDTILQPDILIVCGEITKKYLDFSPTLIVEILSTATALKDRHTKFSIYEQQGVSYYFIVDAEKKSIEIYHLNQGRYQLQPQTFLPELHLGEHCLINPNLKHVFD